MADRVEMALAGSGATCGESHADDLALVMAARRDRDEFAHLYRRYTHQVYRYALARTGSATVADDIVGDAMLAAFEGLARFDPARGSFSGWLFTIVHRRVTDWERGQRRGWQLLARQRAVHVGASGRDDLLDATIRRDEVAGVQAAIARLRPADREVVLLRYSAELSSEEIGHVLGVSRNAARTRLSRALDRIANDLRDTR